MTEQFKISLDADSFEAGSSVKGSIEFKNTQIIYTKALRVVFVGEEKTRVSDKATKQSDEASHTIYKVRDKLSGIVTKGGKIKPGKHKVPFSIAIPPNAPSTISIPWTHLTYQVGYELEDGDQRVLNSAFVDVVIDSKQIPYPDATPFLRNPFLEYVTKNRFRKGHFVVCARIEDTVLKPGQKVGVSVAIRNRSPLRITKIKALLKQEVRARSEYNQREIDKVLTFHEFKEFRKLRRKRLDWLKGHEDEDDFDDVREELESGEHDGELRVPWNSQLTFEGTLFDVKHFLYLLISTEKEDIDIRVIPIQLVRKEPTEEEQEKAEVAKSFINKAFKAQVQTIKEEDPDGESKYGNEIVENKII